MITHTRSEHLVALAEQHLPGGVNSPVRAFKAVGGRPIVIESASGCLMTDVDGNTYIDFVGSWGPMILGHAHPKVLQAVEQSLKHGLSFGATSPNEIELAGRIKQFFPSIELVRLVSSGTEACMSAIRVARGFTGRDAVLKFEGCYHGHTDCLLAKAGSGTMTLGLPDSAGVPAALTEHTYTAPYNDLAAVESIFREKGNEIAAVILEPVVGNMGVVVPHPDFLSGLRELCTRYGSLLILDEVMTGFRLSRGGAQQLYGVVPDLTCLGKIVGGGLPLAAYGGRREIMETLAPLGPVYQAGTLSGNPIASAAGLATLAEIDAQPGLYQHLETIGQEIQNGLEPLIEKFGLQARVQRVGSMWTLFFTDRPVANYADARTCRTDLYARFFQGMLEGGIYLPPSQFESAFLGVAHGRAEIQTFLQVAERVLQKLA
jgi:glutamate-1-semialdehyde 2,1-aminomutase